jgi:hypothetical protein
MEASFTSAKPLEQIKFNAGRILTLASKRVGPNDPPLKVPWVFGQEVPIKEGM